MESNMDVELYVTSMPHEMRNNGHFLKNASVKENDFYLKNRNRIFAVISYAISYESLLNFLIAGKLSQMSNLTKAQKKILNYLKVDSSRNTPQELRSIHKKLKLLEELYKLKGKSLETKDFNTFYNEIIKLRNKIVHFSHAGHEEVYGQRCENISKIGDNLLVKACESLCRKLDIDLPDYYKNLIPIN